MFLNYLRRIIGRCARSQIPTSRAGFDNRDHRLFCRHCCDSRTPLLSENGSERPSARTALNVSEPLPSLTAEQHSFLSDPAVSEFSLGYWNLQHYQTLARPLSVESGDTCHLGFFLPNNPLTAFKFRCGLLGIRARPMASKDVYEWRDAMKARERLRELLGLALPPMTPSLPQYPQLFKIACGAFDTRGRLLVDIYMPSGGSVSQKLLAEKLVKTTKSTEAFHEGKAESDTDSAEAFNEGKAESVSDTAEAFHED